MLAEGAVYTVTVGATALTPAIPSGGTTDTLRLIAGRDRSVTIRVFVDRTIAECFWQSGRVAMTVPLAPTGQSSIVLAAAVSTVTLQDAAAWMVRSIWVTPQEVLERSHRSPSKPDDLQHYSLHGVQVFDRSGKHRFGCTT